MSTPWKSDEQIRRDRQPPATPPSPTGPMIAYLILVGAILISAVVLW